MAGREDTFNKKTIIAIATIIVLLLIAGISVGVFLADKGKTEAAESSQTAERIDNDKKEDNGNSEDQSVQNSDNQVRESQEQNTDGNNEQTQNSDNQTANNENNSTTNSTTNNTANNTSNSVATSNNQTTRNNTTNNKTNNNTTSTSNTQTPANTGKSNNGATTGTNVNEVGETTITRVEEGEEKVVAKKFWDWWNPMSVVVASTTANINAEKPNISVEKSATTEAGENLVYAGEQIKYTINVTNNSKKDVENIEVTDKIPANTTFASINNSGETITSENNIVGVKWIVSVPTGETVTVEFTVTVNPTMVDENGENVETKGIINNKAIANGEESNEVKTAIIKSQKTSAILRDMEQVEKAKIGDTIVYYISVENTADISGKTTIADYVPAGTELIETPRGASVTTDEEGTKIEWKDIDVQANGTKTVFFMVRVTDIDGIIKNVATVGGKDTNEEDVRTADIEIIKNVTDIKREGKSIDKDAKVQAGDVIEYELIVTNKGSENLTNVVVTDELAGIELTDGSWNVGDLESKESKTIKATYTVQYEKDINGNAEKTITNYAVVTGTSVPVIPEETPEEVSDDDDVTTPVEDTPKLEIDKVSTAVNGNPIAEGKTKVRAGDVIEYTIIVKNTGNIKLTNVVITENNTVKVGNETFTVNEETGNVVIKTIPSLAVGETAEAIKAYYTVTEDDVKEAGTIYNLATAKPEETTPVEDDDDNVVVNEDTSVTAKKIWEDNNNQDGIRPDTIELTLYADGTEYKDEKTNQTVKVTVIPEQKADNEWSYTFEKLPTYNKDGAKITYTVVETSIGDKYTTTYSEDGLTVTNSHTPATTCITVNKDWDDNDDQDGIRPENVTLILKANGTEVGRATVGESENWSKIFNNLPVNANGEKIEYTVDEEEVTEGYNKTVDGMTVKNSHTPATTSITVNKDWQDGSNQDGIRPDSVSITLNATVEKSDGEEESITLPSTVESTITLNEGNSWTYTWSGLDKYKNGQEIKYTVAENNVDERYTVSIKSNNQTTANGYAYTVTNSYTPETIDIPVTKVWNDNDYTEARKTITVELWADGSKTGKTIDIKSVNEWKGTFKGLPKYKAGEEITYTIKEKAVDGYVTESITGDSTNGFTITNKYQNVIVNKNVVKSVMNEEKFKSKLDFVFVLDTSSSMQGEKAKTMINALNSTMATILENENNRVGVVGYSDDWYEEKGDNSTTLLELDHYTANSDNKFIKLAGSGDYTYIQANAINSQGNSENAYRYVRGATYTQIGIRDGANLLINESDREGRIPVIILLTDGDPTRYTTEYNNVKQYNRGDGKTNSITAEGAYYTIMSARHYKNAVNDKYKTTENPNIAKFFTIGIDMDKDDIYENTLLNPNKDNVESCRDSNSRSKTRGIYNLMKDNYYKNGGKGSFTGENLNFYSYSDGAFIGNMNEEKLKNILKKTMESIYTYEKETTRTTNIDVDTAVIELEHLDAEKKIEIKINGETTEYTVQELIDSKVVTQTGSKYYMDLNADMFKNKQTIEITYYQVSLLNK